MSRPEQLGREQLGRSMADAKEFQVPPQVIKRTRAFLCTPQPPPPPPCRPPCVPCFGPRK